MTIIEKILARHAGKKTVKPGDIVDVEIDVRIARDFGGPNVVKNLVENGLEIDDPSKTFFTFDTNPTGSDQKYAANQHFCRQFAREKGIKVFDINVGIGTHTAIEEGLAIPGATLVSTDSHANIVGAVCAFGQGMGDQDIAAVWATGKAWFKVPPSAKLILKGERPKGITAKDIVLNLLHHFGANGLLGLAVEVQGEEVERLTLDERITIASMATEMGAIILLFEPNDEVMAYCEKRSGKKIEKITADPDAQYDQVFELDLSTFVPMVSRPGHPDDSVDITKIGKVKIDSAFIGSCTNGRIEDLRIAASILKGRKVAPGVVLKIVPSTDEVWQQMMEESLLKIFKEAGALVGNAGCAGCAAGQIGQNGPGEITISTGNRNFAGKQGKGEVYLASPAVVTASAISGYITTPDQLPERPVTFDELQATVFSYQAKGKPQIQKREAPTVVEGKVWIIEKDNIDTDMIFHNRYLTITQIEEMGQYTFDNLQGWEDFAQKAEKGDIIFTGKNFGAGSSRQQAVDCFKALGVQAILAESFGAIYERNAINAAMPVLTYDPQIIKQLDLKQRDKVRINFETGEIENLSNGKKAHINPFSDVQMAIYKRGGLLNKA
ncbi:homoaconitate hydratase family protein [Caldithrix abyssi DSM 13497]|uniref:Aconitate hydratase A n=1 Tax=Caldithrix abyssi DSM 13497 TaxID=880073 RepID=H1XNP2_CALAY|nr:aconitase/3-isopropylmalate dehydratase large subunit family protein [Caldithrix abyssi]APF19380.1 homoaconitate hydratase family protein/3-isopropylmalate dehydratase, large subunit/3-isopropylmalate dehydratase, small subunit [Caldithrix abyssi DSM 13497]EHO43280.1 homoaconitate hydratase family protein [Caldithrix abyssi DSM 13497]